MTIATRHARNLTLMFPALAVAIIGLLLWLLTPGVFSVIGLILLIVGGAVCLVDLVSSRRSRL